MKAIDNGYVFTRNGTMFVVTGKVLHGLDGSLLYLCQEIKEGGRTLAWPASVLCESAIGQEGAERKPDPEASVGIDGKLYAEESARIDGKLYAEESAETDRKSDAEEPAVADSKRAVEEDRLSVLILESFFDAENIGKKREILQKYKNDLTEGILESMAISLDFDLGEGEGTEEKYYSLDRFLKTRIRYEGR